jgi:hypothetical protein
LQRFLDHLNSIHRNIQFTVHTEGWPLFFSWYNYRRPDGSLGHNLYLNPGPRHHPSNKQAVLATLVHRARALSDKESLHDELEFIPLSGKTGTVWSRYDMPSTQQWKLPSPNTRSPQLLSCHLSRWHTAALAELGQTQYRGCRPAA